MTNKEFQTFLEIVDLSNGFLIELLEKSWKPFDSYSITFLKFSITNNTRLFELYDNSILYPGQTIPINIILDRLYQP